MLRVKGQGDDVRAAALEGLRVKREGLLADLERTLAQKRELLAAVAPDLLPAPDVDAAPEKENSDKKGKKKGGKGKKK